MFNYNKQVNKYNSKLSIQYYCKLATFFYGFKRDNNVIIVDETSGYEIPQIKNNGLFISEFFAWEKTNSTEKIPDVSVYIDFSSSVYTDLFLKQIENVSTDKLLTQITLDVLAALLLDIRLFPYNKILLAYQPNNSLNYSDLNQCELVLCAFLNMNKSMLWQIEPLLRKDFLSTLLGYQNFLALYLYASYFLKSNSNVSLVAQLKSLIQLCFAKKMYTAHLICNFMQSKGIPDYETFKQIPWQNLDRYGNLYNCLIPFIEDSEKFDEFYYDAKIIGADFNVEKIYKNPPKPPNFFFYGFIYAQTLCIVLTTPRYICSDIRLDGNKILASVYEGNNTTERIYKFPLILLAVSALVKTGLIWVINNVEQGQQNILLNIKHIAKEPDILETQTKKIQKIFSVTIFGQLKNITPTLKLKNIQIMPCFVVPTNEVQKPKLIGTGKYLMSIYVFLKRFRLEILSIIKFQ